jgi:hypothetical protein
MSKVDAPGTQQVNVLRIPPCNICKAPAKYDAKTTNGPWAYLCEDHYQVYGVGLGTGFGQKLVQVTG